MIKIIIKTLIRIRILINNDANNFEYGNYARIYSDNNNSDITTIIKIGMMMLEMMMMMMMIMMMMMKMMMMTLVMVIMVMILVMIMVILLMMMVMMLMTIMLQRQWHDNDGTIAISMILKLARTNCLTPLQNLKQSNHIPKRKTDFCTISVFSAINAFRHNFCVFCD